MGCGTKFKPLPWDAEGMVTSYLHSGAPCVVGNLWDVSDRDIDRFFVSLLEDFFNGKTTLPQAVNDARKACKMRYVVAAAPVVYGVPVGFEKHGGNKKK